MTAKIKYIHGEKIGNLTFIGESDSIKGLTCAIFKCHCEKEFKAFVQNVKRLKTLSCGCTKHSNPSNLVHGGTGTAEYHAWAALIQRCNNKNVKNYADYGGRGISVCERWSSFDNFIKDMGKKPSPNHSLDRKDNNGNYEPGNCKWATRKEQNRNTRKNRYLEYNGEVKSLAEWCDKLSLNYKAVALRIQRRKWDVKTAFETPIKTI